MVMGTGPVTFNSENSKYLNSQISNFLVHFDKISKFVWLLTLQKLYYFEILTWEYSLFMVMGPGLANCLNTRPFGGIKYFVSTYPKSSNSSLWNKNLLSAYRSPIKWIITISCLSWRDFTEKFPRPFLKEKKALKQLTFYSLNTILYS